MDSWDVLERHFEGLTAEEVDAELAAVPSRGATPTSATAAAYLAEHAGPDLDGGTGPGSVRQRRTLTAARTLAEVLRSAMTLDEAAKVLGVSRSRVSHRISDGALWAFTVQGRRYLSRWQFASDGDGGGRYRAIPGLPTVVPEIPRSVHPVALDAFMTVARDAFDGRSAVEWLVSGGDPTVVADWLAGMARG